MRSKPILTAVCIAATAMVVLTAVWPSGRTPGVVTSAHAQNQGCSVASLQGAYAFRRTGVNNELGGPVAAIGVTIANGDGTFGGERESISRNGEIQDWTDFPALGHYTIDSDCTGSIFDGTGTHTQNFIVVDGGNGFFLISTLPGRIVTAEGKRIQ
jgi:hypothetical protein